MPGAVQCHGIDGQVPPGQIFLNGLGKFDRIRMAAIGIAAVRAEGGDLVSPVRGLHRDGAVLQSRGKGRRAEDLHDLLGPGGGGNIPVLRLTAQLQIPDAAAHQIGAIAPALDDFQDALRLFTTHNLSSGVGIGCCTSR